MPKTAGQSLWPCPGEAGPLGPLSVTMLPMASPLTMDCI